MPSTPMDIPACIACFVVFDGKKIEYYKAVIHIQFLTRWLWCDRRGGTIRTKEQLDMELDVFEKNRKEARVC